MARPTRDWVRKTYTVSPQVEKAIAMRAAEQGIDPGTVVDIIAWNALVKPEATLPGKDKAFPDEVLERIFAEEVLTMLDGKEAIETLADALSLDGDETVNLQKVRALVGRWRKTRLIEKDHQEALLAALGDGNWLPSILQSGQVQAEWFQAE